MNWLGTSFPVVFVRLQQSLAVLLLALYVAMLWLLLFRRPSFRELPGRVRWNALLATFGVMPAWMVISNLVFLAIAATLSLFKLNVSSVSQAWLLLFLVMLFTWPLASWFSFRIALRVLECLQRRQMLWHLFKRVSAAFALAFLIVYLVFHCFLAGGHSFDHLFEMGPRNIEAVLEWAKEEPHDFGLGYRTRFPVRDGCPLCQMESVVGREAKAHHAKETPSNEAAVPPAQK